MLTMHVLDICLAFEQTTPREMRLRGLALQLLHKSTMLGSGGPGPGPSLGPPGLPSLGTISQDVDGQKH